ncbi:MAG: type II CRISPR RNA-guided endonuclease Cas9 [Nitrospirae bacterium CG02_land_8_20_14_3_00_44_33]|nr:MAG: type II CRISPR RNA-guided endonuclease Cas9 [Nitrospirae bacterium CG02_land_8_20_14_3_00_44_33]
MTERTNNLTLGLDLGSNSLGWALIENEDNGQKRIIDKGVRIFEAGLDNLEQDGRGESRNAARRDARSSRRRLERLSRRLVKLAGILQENGFLPEGNIGDPSKRNGLFTELDRKLDNPYKLRAKGLDNKLEPFEFGRAMYHICQRRGFLSNRKELPKKKEEEGKVKAEIGELQKKIDESGARTLGEYFSKVNPHEERIRTWYTSRRMYEDEFNRLWDSQKNYYLNILTDDLKKQAHHAIFFQRALKSQKNLVGKCEYERTQRRAAWAILDAQEFRYLQRINDLEIILNNERRLLSPDERVKLINELERNSSLKFSSTRKATLTIKKILELPKSASFNLEKGGEENLHGNKTATTLREIFKDRWDEFSRKDKDQIVEDILSIQNSDALARRGTKKWGLDEEAAKKFGNISLQSGYCSFSRKALLKILPKLREGFRLNEILREAYPDRWEMQSEPRDILPPVKNEDIPEIRNPIVERTLSELRKVVNAVIKKHGKPESIRIELARDLRQNAKQRERTFKSMRENEKQRKSAAEEILKECGLANPSRNDILKFILWKECSGHCPYTDNYIGPSDLFSSQPNFDIEHIIPFKRSLDDSFMNKTLSHVATNRNIKKDMTPYEAFSSRPEWDDIISRVKKFNNQEKLKRFKMTEKEVEEFLSDFSSRQLNDTRYATKRAKEYLGLLYGGLKEDAAQGTEKVQAVGGQITAYLRNVWGLNSILKDGPGKSRDDHRHHVVDAIVIALTEQRWVNELSNAAKNAPKAGKRRFAAVMPPWNGFWDDVKNSVSSVIPSHQITKKVKGALHAETFYGRPYKDGKGKQFTKTRVALEKLTPKNVENIVDKIVKQKVKDKLKELGKAPKEAFKNPDKNSNLPLIKTKTGKEIRIKKVRIEMPFETHLRVGEGYRERYVRSCPDSNHHMEIYKDLTTGRWDGEVVSLFKAHQRLRSKQPIIRKHHGEEKKFLFSLAGGETIELDTEDGKRGLFVVRTVPQSKQIVFVPINDSRKRKDIGTTGLTAYPESLKERHCAKVLITPLGEVRRASD